MTVILALIAAVPFLLVFLLMIGFRWPAVKAMPVTFAVTAVLALFVWDLHLATLFVSAFKGIIIAVEILFIIFGALLLLRMLEYGGALCAINRALSSLSRDRRVQALLIGFLFVCFVEAIAGFGTPQALVAPLLIGIGWPALAAAVVTLMADAVPVSFGAVGVPITYGIGSVAPQHVAAVTVNVALIHGIGAFLLPLMILIVLTRSFGTGRWRDVTEMMPFVLLTGAAYAVPMLITAFLLGPELPALVGSIVGFIIVAFAAKKRWFLPASTWEFGRFRAGWTGHLVPHTHKAACSHLLAYLPYTLIAVLLLITRIEPIKSWLRTFAVHIPLGTETYALQLLYSPGTIFLAGCLLAMVIYRVTIREFISEASETAQRLAGPLVALITAIATVQLFLATTMPAALASPAVLLGGAYLIVAPFIGTLGAFIAGSNTVSNLLFAPLQLATAVQLGLSAALVLALQTVGGSAGNMIAVHNVVAAGAATGLRHKEADIIRIVLVPCLLYGVMAVIIGYAILALG